jgi:SNF2 family DNA or RNA helicase
MNDNRNDNRNDNLFYQQFYNYYSELWKTTPNAKKEFQEQCGVKCNKQELIHLLAEKHYQEEELLREEYNPVIQEYNPREFNPNDYEQTEAMEIITPEDQPVVLTNNCTCDFLENDAVFRRDAVLYVNYKRLFDNDCCSSLDHVKLHVRHISNLYTEQCCSFDVPGMDLEYKPCDEHSTVQLKRLNVQLFQHQRNNISWMTGIEQLVKNNVPIPITRYTYSNIKLPNIPVIYDTGNKLLKLQTKTCTSNYFFKGGILADEMGLGKTMSCIGLILNNPCNLSCFTSGLNTKATLIFLQNHLINQWVSECNKFCSPSLRILTVATKSDYIRLTLRAIQNADIVFVSNQFFNTKCDLMTFSNINWYRIMIDEGHEWLRNSHLNRLKHIKSMYRWYISGTPFDNKCPELALEMIMKFIGVESTNVFITHRKLRNSLYNQNDHTEFTITQNILDVNRVIPLTNLLYRRHLSKNLPEIQLPPIITEQVKIDLTEVERNHYNHIKNTYNHTERIRQLCCSMQLSEYDVKTFGHKLKTLSEIQTLMIKNRRDEIDRLQRQIQELRERITTVPQESGLINATIKRYTSTIEKTQKSIEYFQNVIQDIAKEFTCSICFEESKTRNVINACGHYFCGSCITQVDNCPVCRKPFTTNDIIQLKSDETNQMVEMYGSKIAEIIKYIHETIPRNQKFLIFCEWDRMLNNIVDVMNNEDISIMKCDGSVFRRNKIIHQFKNTNSLQGLALSTTNTAAGMHLTNAKYILFINPTMNKDNEFQAISRSYRIGQTDNVRVVHFITKDTIEEELI